jgi:hypothetical protein
MAKPGAKFRSPHEAAARAVLANVVAGRFDAAAKDFNDTMLETVTPAALTDIRKQLDTELGAFQVVTGASEQTENGLRTVELMVRYEKALASFKVAFDEQDKIAAIYFNKIAPETVDAKLEASARALLQNFVAGRFDDMTKEFNDTLHAQLTPVALADLSGKVAETFGTFQSILGVRQRTTNEYREITIAALYSESRVAVLVVFDKEGRISGMRISPWKG